MSDEAGLPKSTVNKVIKDCVPADLKIAAEVRDLVADASLGMCPLVGPFSPLLGHWCYVVPVWSQTRSSTVAGWCYMPERLPAFSSLPLVPSLSLYLPILPAFPVANYCGLSSIEFLQLVASEANDICTKENKTLIAADHIMKALTNLGFSEYLDEVTQYQAKLKRESAERSEKSKSASNTEGLTDAELYAQQQALFEATN